ncbi:fructosamine kinase family protein [Actinomyces sp.]
METIRKTDSRRGRIAYEVAGLAWLAEASDPGAAVVPVLDHGATWLEEPRVVSVSPSAQDAEAFGRALAHTHAAGATHLGAAPDGYAGDGWMGEAPLSLPERPSARGEAGGANRADSAEATPASSPRESWGAFYARERIAPYLDMRVFTASERHLIERLCERLDSGDLDHGQPRLVADAITRCEDVGAARTHGDLWNGNVMWTPSGAVLIDPAAQGGHAEEDLAALAVFGCPHYEPILAAYNEASPLEDGWRERLTLHQAHIIMIHCAVFGRSYVPDAVAIARRYA